MQKRFLITGASRGIGHELSKNLAKSGHNVIATARSTEALNHLKSGFPDKIEVVVADLTESNAADRFKELLKSREQHLDGLVHNAGLLINKPFMKLTDQDWQKMLHVNLLAPVQLTRELVPYCNQNCHVLTISSMGGFQGSKKFPGLSGYSTAKGAISVLSECLAAEFPDQKIVSNSLCLGAVQTEMLDEAFPGMNAPVSAEDMAEYIARFLLNGHRFYNGKILPVALSDPD